MPPESAFLFTYGTLKKGFENTFARKLRAASEYVSEGHFPGRMYRIEWYPGAIADATGPGVVHGEIYHLHSVEIMRDLDDYEDVMEDEASSLYVRRIVAITTPTVTLQCWTYLYNQPVDGFELISDGRFTG